MTTDFKEVIGQQSVKNKLGFFLDSYRETRIVPPILFTAPKGQGKSLMARELARRLTQRESNLPKKFVSVNAASFQNSVDNLFDTIILPYVIDKESTVFIDEASELPGKITMSLLTILEPNKDNRTQYNHRGTVYDFDLSKTSWIFATSEPQKMFSPLIQRFERIDLEESSIHDLKEIITLSSKIKIDDGVLTDIASVCRKSPRLAVGWANKLKITGKKYIGKAQWEVIKQQLSVVKLGLTHSELRVLRLLSEGPNTLTSLAAKTDYGRQALQREIEPGLMKHGLIEITLSGRELTEKGRKYLQEL